MLPYIVLECMVLCDPCHIDLVIAENDRSIRFIRPMESTYLPSITALDGVIVRQIHVGSVKRLLR